MKNFKLFSLSPAMCVFLVACGGGGGGPSAPTDTTAPVITITGSASVNHEQGTTYTDEGATATDAVDGSVTVSTSGSVDDAAGTYTITYSATDSAGNAATATRTVIVADTIAPTITLNGAAAVTHEQGTTYVDEGATATDSVDTTVEVVVTGAINAAIAGEYTLTYTATDQAGNASSTTRTVVVSDTTVPVVSLIGPATLVHEQGTIYSDPGATAIDSVDGSINIVVTGSVGAGAGSYVLTYSATDSAGNGASASRTVIVSDSTSPTITLIGEATVNHEQGTTYIDSGATAVDTVDGVIAVTSSGSVGSGAGTYTITYSASDAVGNSAIAVRTVIVGDTIAPVITLSGDAEMTHEQGTTYTDAGASAADTVDTSVDVVTTGSVDSDTAGTYTVTYTATDAAGNMAAAVTRKVTVGDTTVPVITLTGDASVNHEQATAYTDAGATVTDTVDTSIEVVTAGAVDIATAGTYTLTYSATDSAGNEATTVTRAVTVADTIAPVIVLNGAANISHEQGTTYTDAGASASDSVDGSVSVTTSGTVDTTIVGTYTLTYTATDASSNTATAARSVTVTDSEAPTITLIGESSINHEQGTTYTDAGATASDIADGSVTVTTSGIVDTTTAGTYTLTYTATDSAGNTATAVTRTVIVADTVVPVITLSGSATVNHEEGTTYIDDGATATDAVDGDLTNDIVVTSSAVDTSITIPEDKIGNGPDKALGTADDVTVKGSYVAGDLTFVRPPVNLEAPASTWCPTGDGCTAANNTAKDAARMGTNLGFRRMQFEEAEAWCAAENGRLPTRAEITTHIVPLVGNGKAFESDLVWPQAKSKYWTADKNAAGDKAFVFTTRNSSNDNVVNSVTNTVALVNSPLWVMCVGTAAKTVDTSKAGTYTLTYNVSDAAGNAATAVTRTVIVADTVAPVITLSGATSVNHEQGTTYTDAGASASDSVDGSVSVTTSGTVDTATAGTYTLTYTATDSAGNAATAVTRTVIVADTVAPVITLSGSASVNHEQGTTYTDEGATASDSVDGTISVGTTGSVNFNVVGTYTLTYTATDSAGNAATAVTRTVIVADTVAPVITLSGTTSVNHEQGTTYVDAGASASDSVDGSVSVTTSGTVDTATAGTYTLTYTATDSAGNAATALTRTVIVADTVVPVITLSGSASVNHEQGVTYSDAGASASDSVDGSVSVTTSGTVDTATAGTYTLTYTATDSAGNAATAVTRTVIVADTVAPVITLSGSASVNHEQGVAYSDAGASASDSVDGSVSVTTSGTVDTLPLELTR